MIIDIIDDDSYLTESEEELIRQVLELAAKRLQLGDLVEVDVSIVSNEVIHQLNKDYRGVDRPTDVLSFALEEDIDDAPIIDLETYYQDNKEGALARHLGDIIISYRKAQEQAEDYSHSLERELAFLSVHGFLHLNGFDHQTEEEEKIMFSLQEEILNESGYERG